MQRWAMRELARGFEGKWLWCVRDLKDFHAESVSWVEREVVRVVSRRDLCCGVRGGDFVVAESGAGWGGGDVGFEKRVGLRKE